MKKFKSPYLLAALSVPLIGLIILGVLYSSEPEIPETEMVQAPPAPERISVEEEYPHSISPDSTLFSVLRGLNISPQAIQEIVTAAKPYTNLAMLRPGTRFKIYEQPTPVQTLTGIKFRFSPVEFLEIKKTDEKWVAERILEKVDVKVVTFSGTVTSSLWESAEGANMDFNLISELSEIFGWQVDFAREVRAGDRWRLSVEKRFVKGEPIGWGSILSAEYENDGELHSAILFKKDGKELGYFSPEGNSLRRMFLKSPIKFGRISSRFSKSRFHPVLQINRPHLGVDYAAPVGTPIRAVGDGVITTAGWRGGAGNMIKLKHNATYETAYKHLKGFGRGIKSGSRVRQGDIIGYVGTTGLSTGPHLHFEFYINGRFVDPLGQRFPSADPVPKDLMEEFKQEVTRLSALLPEWKKPVVETKAASVQTKTANSDTIMSK
jgi:murein DD-endopeptidase MepM/ murein hydrolase activator NlpD